MRLRIRRRSDSSLVSPGPLVPIPPACLLNRVPCPRKRGRWYQQGQLDLEHAFAAGGVLGEYVEDQGFSIDDVALEDLLEVSLLGRRQ